jgi:hypothetical protein
MRGFVNNGNFRHYFGGRSAGSLPDKWRDIYHGDKEPPVLGRADTLVACSLKNVMSMYIIDKIGI